MKKKMWVIVGLIVVFVIGVGVALLREVQREEQVLAQSISGVVEVAPSLIAQGVADIVKTDRLVLMLVDPDSLQPVAVAFESPLVPPQNIRIGQANATGGQPLQGSFLVVGITDKDGEIFKVTPGEIYGRSDGPVPLGEASFRLALNAPFRGSLLNEPGAAGGPAPAVGTATGYGAGAPSATNSGSVVPPTMMSSGPPVPEFSIAGTITVSEALQGGVAPGDRLLIMMFDPDSPQPVAIKMIPHTLLPQAFTITLPEEARGSAKKAYSLRILTDKDNNPVGAVEGEVVGRSPQPVPLGTNDLEFKLDQPYRR